MVFVTLTLLQVAVEEQECPFPRYLPLCIYSEAVTYLKEVIEELSNKIEQSSDSKGYTRILDSINLQEEEKWAPESDSDPTTILVKYNGVNRNPYVKWSTFFQADSIQTNLLCAEKLLCALYGSLPLLTNLLKSPEGGCCVSLSGVQRAPMI